MVIRTKTPVDEIIIDLTGPQGNAYCLLGYASDYAKQLGYSQAETTALLDDMKSADYEHLIEVFDEHFGDYVVLER